MPILQRVTHDYHLLVWLDRQRALPILVAAEGPFDWVLNFRPSVAALLDPVSSRLSFSELNFCHYRLSVTKSAVLSQGKAVFLLFSVKNRLKHHFPDNLVIFYLSRSIYNISISIFRLLPYYSFWSIPLKIQAVRVPLPVHRPISYGYPCFSDHSHHIGINWMYSIPPSLHIPSPFIEFYFAVYFLKKIPSNSHSLARILPWTSRFTSHLLLYF